MWIPLMEYTAVLVVLTLLTIPMGKWLARCLTSEHHTWLERLTYGALGVNPNERMGWQRYGAVLVLSNVMMMLLGYALLRLQGSLPLNPLAIAAQTPDLAFNTAASFITNTNWQAYAGENSLTNATQMAAITFLMFAGATTGVAAGAGFVRGLARSSSQDIGNFWVDFVRVFWRVLLPLSFVMALVYVWQGIPQTLSTEVVATTLEVAKQQLLMGPVASFESIKHLGTNGGGFFSMNAAHPFENPTPLTNLLHIFSMLLIPAGLTYAFGAMLLRRKQGWVLFGACMVMFIGFFVQFFRYWKHNFIDKEDIKWMKSVKTVLKGHETGDVGKYNGGQKGMFWLMTACMAVLLCTGFIAWRPYFAEMFPIPVIRLALLFHAWAALILIAGIIVHVYAAFWVKGTIRAMVEGVVTQNWAKKHHPRWYREMMAKNAEAEREKGNKSS